MDKGKILRLWLPVGMHEKIVKLMDALEVRGIDLRDDKHPDRRSISKLFRYLIESTQERISNE